VPKHDAVSAPAHYVSGRSIEPLDVIEDWGLPHHLACALKYIARCQRKGSPQEDVRKAIFYLERFHQRLERARNQPPPHSLDCS
jgi:hypothetical protein